MKSFELYKLKNNGVNYTIRGNSHSINQLYKRRVNIDNIKYMVKNSISKIEIQQTKAVIYGHDKLLILRINRKTFFIITCLISNMYVKRNTKKIYL